MKWLRTIIVCAFACLIVAAAAVVTRHIKKQYAVQPIPSVSEEPSSPTPLETYVKLPQVEVEHLLSGNCATIRSVDELPENIKNAFATVTRDKPFALANPRARFNATDVIEEGLPRRRLVLGGHCEDQWFIEYEHGGIGLSVILMVLGTNPDRSVTLRWGRYLQERARNVGELRAALAGGAFQDGPCYW